MKKTKSHVLNLKDAVAYLRKNIGFDSYDFLVNLQSGDIKAFVSLDKSKNTEFFVPADYWDKKSAKSIRYTTGDDENFSIKLSYIYNALLEDFLSIEADFASGKIPNFEQDSVFKFWFLNLIESKCVLEDYKKRYLELKTIFVHNINNNRIVQVKIEELNNIIVNSADYALPKVRRRMLAKEEHWHLIIKQLPIGVVNFTLDTFKENVLKSIRSWESANKADLHITQDNDENLVIIANNDQKTEVDKAVNEIKVKPLTDGFITKLAATVWTERGMHDFLTDFMKKNPATKIK